MADPVRIIIPVYNEGANIEKALERIAGAVAAPYRVAVVYDRDDDDTLPVVRRLAKERGLPVDLVKNAFGRGALNAIKTGLRACQDPYAVVTMADLSDPPEVINLMREKARREGLDVVCGSRYMKGGSQKGGPLLKRTLSRLAGLSLRWLTSIPTHDVTNSFKLYSRRVIDTIHIESTGGFELGLEVVVKAHFLGLRVGEVPTSWEDRTQGASRFRLWAWMPKYMRWYLYALRSAWFGRPSRRDT